MTGGLNLASWLLLSSLKLVDRWLFVLLRFKRVLIEILAQLKQINLLLNLCGIHRDAPTDILTEVASSHHISVKL